MLKSEIKDLLDKPAWVLFLAVWFFYLAGLALFSHFVWSSELYEIGYRNDTGFENYLGMVRRVDFARYILSPLYIFVLSVIIAALIKIGLTGYTIEVDNKLLFKIIVTGIFFLSLPFWVKAVWFVLIKGSYSSEEIKYFYPLSGLYFFDTADLHMRIVKALGKINLYHLAFMLYVASCLKLYTTAKWWRLFGIVCITYGLGLVLLQAVLILIFM